MNFLKKPGGIELYALVFGLFLGLAIIKFGNPVILDQKISRPTSAAEFWQYAWPTHWANWGMLPLALVGGTFACTRKRLWSANPWLWLLPAMWFGCELFSAAQTEDAELTAQALWQFFGCLSCYLIGATVLGSKRLLPWLLPGVLAAFIFCLVRAIDQRVFEFPQSYQMLVEGQRTAWTNLPPSMVLEMKQENVILNTNGVDVVNPAILKKFASGRVNGTLVYPNALAGLILLLFPISMALVIVQTTRIRPFIRAVAIALALFLGGSSLFWSGSKLGWLIAILLGTLCLFRLRWAASIKWTAAGLILVVGLGIFTVRFHHYFSAGATSVGARFDYWRAAGRTAVDHPWSGTGPGTFQRPYARLKSPESEMARLAHNDYLEQFSDSGFAGGIFYGLWVMLALVTVGRQLWQQDDPVAFAIFLGLLGWFCQALGEFGLYVPALAWTAFTLLGVALTLSGNQFDKKPGVNYPFPRK